MNTEREFASANLTIGQINAIVKKLGGHDEAIKFLQGKLAVSESIPSWRERNGIIYLSVTSDGTTGHQWIDRLNAKGFRLSDRAKSMLRSSDFKPTKRVKTEIAIIKGALLYVNDRYLVNVENLANQHKLSTPNAEVACLIRENFSDKDIEEMDLILIVTMHKPIKDSRNQPQLLCQYRNNKGHWLDVHHGEPPFGWDRLDGFAYVVSQTFSQS